MSLLTLSMIVKNEEALLPGCIKSIKDFVDEIIIIDTGSSDNTVEVARSFNARIEHLAWVDDFSLARNFALSFVKTPWTLWLDADDLVFNPEGLQEMCERAHKLRVSGLWTIYEQDSACRQRRLSFFKTKEYYWAGVVHESPQIKPGKEGKQAYTDVKIKHRKPKERSQEAAKQYLNILLEKDPENWIGIGESYKFLFNNPDDESKRLEYLENAENNYYQAYEWKHTSADARYLCLFNMTQLLMARHDLFPEERKNPIWAQLALGYSAKAVEMFPKRAECWVLKGQILQGLGDEKYARQCYEQARNLPLPDTLGIVLPAYYDLLPNELINRLDHGVDTEP